MGSIYLARNLALGEACKDLTAVRVAVSYHTRHEMAPTTWDWVRRASKSQPLRSTMSSSHASLGAELPTNEKKKQEWAKKSKTKASSQLWLHRGSSLLPPLAGRCGRGIGFLRFRTLSWLQMLVMEQPEELQVDG